MHVHNVGQGNAVFLKNGTMALIVDCGSFKTGKYCFSSDVSNKRHFDTGGIFRPIVNFLSGISEITVVITHRHYDHHSLLRCLPDDLYNKISTIYERVHGESEGYSLYLPDGAEDKITLATAMAKELHNIKVKSGKLIPWIHVDKVSDIPIRGSLGANVEISPILPTVWPTTGKDSTTSNDPNDNCISLVVKYGKGKILLTGDSTGATLNAVQKVPQNIIDLQNVTCMLLPHHGSNLNGAFTWFYFVKSNITPGFQLPLLTLISSDPKEAHSLPWAGVSKFTCDRPGASSKVPQHIISTEKNGMLKYTVDEPVYLTADAQRGFWTVLFNLTDGSLALYDGACESPFTPDQLRNAEPVGFDINALKLEHDLPTTGDDRKKAIIIQLLENVGAFSENLPAYINWIVNAVSNQKMDNDLLISCIKNFNAFLKEPIMQKNFSTPLLQYLFSNMKLITEELVVSCVNNQDALFVDSLKDNFKKFLYEYLAINAKITKDLLLSCVKQASILFLDKWVELAKSLLNHLSEIQYTLEGWQECMIAITMHMPDVELLQKLSALKPK
jgi:metal-dependent hydrolase (beta-lactamase superfamily II)